MAPTLDRAGEGSEPISDRKIHELNTRLESILACLSLLSCDESHGEKNTILETLETILTHYLDSQSGDQTALSRPGHQIDRNQVMNRLMYAENEMTRDLLRQIQAQFERIDRERRAFLAQTPIGPYQRPSSNPVGTFFHALRGKLGGVLHRHL